MSEVYGRQENSWRAVISDLKLLLRKHKLFKGAGFEVQFLSTWELEYRETERHIRIGTGIGKDSRHWWDTWVTVELDDISHWNSGETLKPADRVQIASNLSAAFRHFGIPFQFV